MKGTTLSFPRFFLYEGERKFSVRERTQYTLLVVYAIDLVAKSHRVFRWDGAIDPEAFLMDAQQWTCEARSAAAE